MSWEHKVDKFCAKPVVAKDGCCVLVRSEDCLGGDAMCGDAMGTSCGGDGGEGSGPCWISGGEVMTVMVVVGWSSEGAGERRYGGEQAGGLATDEVDEGGEGDEVKDEQGVGGE